MQQKSDRVTPILKQKLGGDNKSSNETKINSVPVREHDAACKHVANADMN